jgi:lysophospholipase L1-like esterase
VIPGPADVDRFLRGCAWPGTAEVPYPRADPADAARLPADTWAMAQIPVGVRLELVGDATAIEVDYTCATADLGYRREGAGTTFAAWRGERLLDEQPAHVGSSTVLLELRSSEETGAQPRTEGPDNVVGSRAGEGDSVGDATITVYLPEGMRPTVLGVRPVDGTVQPAPARPRWLCYGDSIAEGWVATGPARAWPAIAARRFGLDVVNLGYAGAARGEIVSAEQISALGADVISITHGTNCWTRIPHSVEQVRSDLTAFVDVVRQAHPETPLLVASPVLRPDAEGTPNRLGATLADIRATIEDVVRERMARGDDRLTLIAGGDLLDEGHLADGIHPGDSGHAVLASALGRPIADAVGKASR